MPCSSPAIREWRTPRFQAASAPRGAAPEPVDEAPARATAGRGRPRRRLTENVRVERVEVRRRGPSAAAARVDLDAARRSGRSGRGPGRARRPAPGRARRLVEQPVGLGQPAELDERHPEIGGSARGRRRAPAGSGRALEQVTPAGRSPRCERRRPAAARRAAAGAERRGVAPRVGCSSAGESGRPARGGSRRARREPRRRAREPRREALVQAARAAFGQGVGDVADQDVVEAVDRLAGQLALRRADEMLPASDRERVVEPRRGRQQRRPRCGGRSRPRPPRGRRRRARAGGRRSMRAASRAWIVGGRPAGAPPARRASRPSARGRTGSLGRREQALAVDRGGRVPAASSASSAAAAVSVERLERDDGAAAASLIHAGRRSKSSGRARQTTAARRRARGGGDVLQGVEQRRLGPVDVVDEDDERTVARRDLEQAPDGPVRLLDRDRAGRTPTRRAMRARDAAAPRSSSPVAA